MRRTVSVVAILLLVAVSYGCSSEPGSGGSDDEDAQTMDDTGESMDAASPMDGGTDESDADDESDAGGSEDADFDADPDGSESDTTGGSGEMDVGDAGQRDGSSDTDAVAVDVPPGSDATTSDGGMLPDPDTADGSSGDGGSLPTSFGPGTFIDAFYVDKENPGTPRCCFDIDGDGDPDNALAEFLDEFSSLGFGVSDVNTTINDRISNGDLVYLFEYADWDQSNWQDDATIEMTVHPGQDESPPFDDNLNGIGQFEILPESYDASGDPRSVFNSAETTPDGSEADLSADGGTIRLPIDFGSGLSATLRIARAQLTAAVPGTLDLSPGGGVPLAQGQEWGQLGGAIPKSDVYAAVNRAAGTCSCYDSKAPQACTASDTCLIVEDSSQPETYECQADLGCSCSNQTVQQLEFGCGGLVTEAENKADVNLKDPGTTGPDALSFGASFEGIDAEIVGIAN